MNLFPHSQLKFPLRNELLKLSSFSIITNKWIPASTMVSYISGDSDYGDVSQQIDLFWFTTVKEESVSVQILDLDFDDEMHALILTICPLRDFIYNK